MADTKTTRDHEEIEDWIVDHGGLPAREAGSFAELRVDFEGLDDLEELSWKEFFEILDSENLAMEYEEEQIGGDSRPPSEKYDFIVETRNSSQDVSGTEMDEESVKANTEETSG